MDLHHLQLGGDKIQNLGNVLADQPQHTAAIGTAPTRVKDNRLPRRIGGDAGLAAAAGRDAFVGLGLIRNRTTRIVRPARLWPRVGGGTGHLEAFEGEFQLLDLALDLLGACPVLLPLQPGDADLERLDQRLVGPVRCLHPGDLPVLSNDDCPQRGRVFGQGVEADNHART